MLKFTTVLLAILLVQTLAAADGELNKNGPLIALELEVHQNTLDGCANCRCRVRGELAPGVKQAWWMSFGLAKAHEEDGWAAAGARSHCGSGPFEDVARNFNETVGNPYLVLDLSTMASVVRTGGVSLQVELSTRKLTGFDRKGRPEFTISQDNREFRFGREGELTIAVLLPDPREKAAFGIHDVLLQLGAVSLERKKPASFGAVSVSGDVPGAAVLVDGGFVGRLAEEKPLIVNNVLIGSREIRLRDFSGREALSKVRVKQGATAEVVLNVLDLKPKALESDLVKIGENPQGHEEYWRSRDGAMVVKVPAGAFLMGSAEGVGEANERPQHEVDLPEFMIDKTEVTWRQFRKYAEAKNVQLPPAPIWGRLEDYPISFVLLAEASAYCEWAGARLPSEAEWEKAARGTDGRRYPWGDDWDPTRCNTISGGMHRPEAAGSLPDCVSPYGVLDMAGSVQEWTADLYKDYVGSDVLSDTGEQVRSGLYVMRGGGWMSQPTWARTTYRHKRGPNSRNMDHGFRCAQDVPVASK
jgi:formylglycine-generating enzyme required for sulfatase activity